MVSSTLKLSIKMHIKGNYAWRRDEKGDERAGKCTVNWGNLGNRGNLNKNGMSSLTTLVGHGKYFLSKIHMRLVNFVIFLCRKKVLVL